MASEKKASEGIALLSMYGDEDDEMEELDEDVEGIHEGGVPQSASGNDNDCDYVRQREASDDNSTTPASVAAQQPLFSPQQSQQQQPSSDLNNVQSQKSRLTIVDYGHEEGAMSPEAEEGEIMATGRVMYGKQLQSSDGESRDKISPAVVRLPTPSTQITIPQSSEQAGQPESDAMNDGTNESDAATEDVDPLDNFLPPPPKAKCSEELQEKIIRFLVLKKTTVRSFNAEVRNRKEYRNPDFLLHAVTYQDIDQIGSCFHKDVFDPHGYDKSDFYDEIGLDLPIFHGKTSLKFSMR